MLKWTWNWLKGSLNDNFIGEKIVIFRELSLKLEKIQNFRLQKILVHYKTLQFQFSVGPGRTAIFGHKSVTQPFPILKTEKTPCRILKTPQKWLFYLKSWHIITNYDSPCMKTGGHFTMLNPSKMSRLGAIVSWKFGLNAIL